MQYGLGRWQVKGRWAVVFGVGLSLATLGCHEKKDLSIAGVPQEASTLLAAKGAAAIATVCTRQSYATAKLGLIAGETGLQEDVFEMRDPVSFTIVPYRLKATVRLEALLRQGAEAAGRPKDQTQCMQEFADHLSTLSDPLLDAAKSEKAVDALAFHDAEKEAQQEIETQERMEKSSR